MCYWAEDKEAAAGGEAGEAGEEGGGISEEEDSWFVLFFFGAFIMLGKGSLPAHRESARARVCVCMG
jgi:hypothetical protein